MKRLKTFVMTMVDRLDKVTSRNNLLETTIEKLVAKEQVLKQDNQRLSDYATKLKTENTKLKKDNESLKGSKTLLEDLQEVLTDKEVNNLNKRLEKLREAQRASRKRDEPNQSKGRSI
nr:hypothetical protein [Streptococcus gallolyticus]